MIRCACGGKTQVTNTRPLGDGIWRQRTCTECKARVTTFEQVCVTLDAPRGATKGSTKAKPLPRVRREIKPLVAPVISRDMVRSEPPGPRISAAQVVVNEWQAVKARTRMEDARMKKELDDGGY